jgi:hypothetical protein
LKQKQEQAQAEYFDLVARLARNEEIDVAESSAILQAVGKTAADLEAAVNKARRVAELQAEILDFEVKHAEENKRSAELAEVLASSKVTAEKAAQTVAEAAAKWSQSYGLADLYRTEAISRRNELRQLQALAPSAPKPAPARGGNDHFPALNISEPKKAPPPSPRFYEGGTTADFTRTTKECGL